MAGVIVASVFLELVVEKLASGIIKEFGLLWGVKGDLDRLESTLGTIKDVLEDAESRSIKEKPLYNWLAKLKDAAYDADDLLNEFQMEAEQRKLELRDHKMIRKVSCFLSRSNPIMYRFKMSHMIKEMRERLDVISAERIKFHLKKRDAHGHGDGWKIEMKERATWSDLDQTSVCGRENDVEKIMSLLLKTNDVSIIPIVGMGGLGKTTLAQLVYNDKRADKNQFDVRSWVYVSADFEPIRIAREAIASATGQSCNLNDLETVGNGLKETLRGKRFLLVLDDVWNEDANKWEKLKPMLNVGLRGSRIIVTTRSEKVALIMGTTIPYHLKGLSDDDCWKLFKQRAFGKGGEEAQYPQLVAIGKEIVNKCGGVPLAAKALGSIMRFKRKEDEWLAVRDNEMWKLTEQGAKVLASLRLSYTHLPSPVKQCFAYCSVFPKGYTLDKDTLTSQWIALGFIPSLDGSLQIENIANEYFNDLLWMSFLQDLKDDIDSGTVTCKMHDLVHDLAGSVAGIEVLAMDAEKAMTGLAKGCRYASLIGYSPSTKVPANINLKKVRALHTYSSKPNSNAEEFPGSILPEVRCLRTLHLSNERIVLVPKLRNLRYLHASIDHIQTLPESICGLLNLQTLHLINCSFLETLPESIGDLHNLWNLKLTDCHKLQSFPDSFGELHNLRNLKLTDCHKLQSIPDSFGNLQKLLSLNITRCHNLQALPESVSNLTHLESLNLASCRKLQELPKGLGNFRNLRYLNNELCDSLCGMPPGIGQLVNLRVLPMFVVGKEEDVERGRYCSIRELEHLNHIKGELLITNLERVMNPTDAKKANLKEKRNLHSLNLLWEQLREEEWDQDHAVFESLLPPPCTKWLEIDGYLGTKLPSWMVAPSLPNLVVILLWGLKRCDRLEPLEQLPSLQILVIGGMHGIRHMDASFPSLEALAFMDMPNFEEWTTTTAIADDGQRLLRIMTGKFCKLKGHRATLFPRLSRIIIDNCCKLKVHPCLPASIERLNIRSSSEELLSAKSLRVLPSSRVKRLHITSCGASSGWEGLRYLTVLEDLSIQECEELRCLPESMRHLSSLQFLLLLDCNNLLELPEWVGDLCSLRSLTIQQCSSLTSLPQGLRRLALDQLIIDGCPNLVGRCERDRGEDWDNIKHIPHINIIS